MRRSCISLIPWGGILAAPLLALAAPPLTGPLLSTTAQPSTAVVSTRAQRLVEVPRDHLFSGRVIVRAKSVDSLKVARAKLAFAVVRHVSQTNEDLLSTPKWMSDDAFVTALRATGLFEYAEPDWLCFTAATTTPNDPGYASQWHLPKINAPAAWATTTGGSNITIAIVDTGIDTTHPDFAGRLAPGYNAADFLAQADGGVVTDANGHGTQCAGIAAATGNNALAVAGLAWGVKIMPIRGTHASDSGNSIALSTISNGIIWAVDHGARVVSVSLTGVEQQTIESAGQYCRQHNVLLVYAAGNGSSPSTQGPYRDWNVDWPDVTIVAATDSNDARPIWSGYGPAIDLAAPGVDIVSTFAGGSYGDAGLGTSFATPQVAGVAALMCSVAPTIPVSDLEARLLNACLDLGDTTNMGYGRLDADKAVRSAAAYPSSAPIVQGESVTATGASAVTIDVLANDFDPYRSALSLFTFDSRTTAGGSVAYLPGAGPGGRDELVYTPPRLVGTDTFTYTVANAASLKSVATVTIAVNNPVGTSHAIADVVSVGQQPPPDGLITGDDYVAFINAFFTGNLLADVVSVGQQPPPDGLLTGDDYVAFINSFFVGR